MNIAESAILAVVLKLEDQLSGGVARAEGELAGLNTTAKASGTHLTTLAGRAGIAGKAVGGFDSALTHAKKSVGGLIAGPLGVIGLGAGLFSLAGLFEKSVGRAQDFGMEVSKLSKLTGLSVETTSALASALEHFGVGSDAALRSVGFLEKNVGLLAARKDGIANFEKSFGLALTDTNGHIKDANALILASADYFNNKAIPATTKAAALAKLYGRSWQELIPFLSAGSKGIKDAEAAAASLGLTLDKTNVQDLAKFKESTRELGTAMGGLELQLGLALVPALNDLTNAAARFVAQNRTGLVSFFKQAVEVGRGFASFVTGTLVPAFQSIAGGVLGLWNQIPGPVKDLLVKGYVTNRVVKFLFGVDVVGDIGKALGGAISGAVGKSVGTALVGAGLGKLFVQPVFVTNMGVGGLGGLVPGAAGAAGAAGGGLGLAAIAPLIAVAVAEIVAAGLVAPAVQGALGITPGGTGRTQQVGPLTVRFGGSDAALFRAAMAALAPQPGEERPRTVNPILRPGIVDSPRTTALSAADVAGLLARGRAAGFHPLGIAAAEATNQRNLLRAQERTRLAINTSASAIVAAIRKIRFPGSNTTIINSTGGPDDRGGLTPVQRTQNQREGNVTIKAVASTRDISTAGTVKLRYGPTVAQAGGI